MNLSHHSTLRVISVLFFGVALFFGTWAISRATDNELTVCVKRDGEMRMVGMGFRKSDCKRGEKLVSWSTDGAGGKGDKGDKGDTGTQGPVGPQGAKGDKGDRGVPGASSWDEQRVLALEARVLALEAKVNGTTTTPNPVPPPPPPQTGTMVLSKYSAFPNQSVVVPQTAVKIAEFRLQAGSTEDIQLQSILLSLTGTIAQSDISDVYITYGANTTVVHPTSNPIQDWTINTLLTKNSTSEIKVYATISSTALAGANVISALRVDGTGVVSNASTTSGYVQGQTVTATIGSLTATIDASTPVMSLAVSGSQPKVASFKFTGINDSFTVTELYASTTQNAGSVIGNLIWKDGATTIATTPFVGAYATATGLSVAIPANSTKVIDAYLQLADVNTPGGAVSGLNVRTSLNGYRYHNTNGVEWATPPHSVNAVGNSVYVYKTKPTISNVALPSTTLTAGTQTISKFTVSADSAGSIEWNKLSLNVSKTFNPAIASTSFALYDDANPSTPLDTTLTAIGNFSQSGSGGVITFVLATPQSVSGSKTYVVKATVSGSIVSGDSISTSIFQGSSASVVGSYATVAGGASSFVWSDLSTVPHDLTSIDWISDFIVKNLPTDSQTLIK